MLRTILATLFLYLHGCLSQWTPAGDGPWVLIPTYPSDDYYFLNANIDDFSVTVSLLSDFSAPRAIMLDPRPGSGSFLLLVSDCEDSGTTCQAFPISWNRDNRTMYLAPAALFSNNDFVTQYDQTFTFSQISDISATLYYNSTSTYLDVNGTAGVDGNGDYKLQMDPERKPLVNLGQEWTFIPYTDVITRTSSYTATVTNTVTTTLPPASTITSVIDACADKPILQRDEPYFDDGTFYGTDTTVSVTVATDSIVTTTYNAPANPYATTYITNTHCKPSNSPTSMPTLLGASAGQAAPPSASKDLSSGARAGIIAGSTIAGILLIIILTFLICFLKRRKRRQRREEETREISAVYYGLDHDFANNVYIDRTKQPLTY